MFTTHSRSEEKKISMKSSFNLKAAMVPMIGLILIGVLPEYLKNLSIEYTDQLLNAYVTAGYIFLGSVFAGIAIMVLRDSATIWRAEKTSGGLAESVQKSAVFGWRPGESHLTGKKTGRKESAEKEEENREADKS